MQIFKKYLFCNVITVIEKLLDLASANTNKNQWESEYVPFCFGGYIKFKFYNSLK